MSASLVRKGLELLSDDLDIDTKKKPQGKIAKKKKGKRNKDVRVCLLEEYRRRQKQDKTKENLKLLKMLDVSVTSDVSEKIVSFNRGRLAKNQPQKEEAVEEGSAFTEEDFQKFEEEYFVRGKF